MTETVRLLSDGMEKRGPLRRYFDSRSGKSAKTLCTMFAVSSCGSTTGALDPGFEL